MVTCFHLADGTILLGTVQGSNSESFIVKDTFILTKVRSQLNDIVSGASAGQAPVRVILTKYDSFNHAVSTSIDLMKGGILSKYECDEAVEELYNDFVVAQNDQISTSDNPNSAESFTDMISKVLNESKSTPNFDEIRRATIRTRKPDDKDD